jgi:Ferritin-like domain
MTFDRRRGDRAGFRHPTESSVIRPAVRGEELVKHTHEEASMTALPQGLDELLEASQDLQVDAIVATREPLAELAQSGRAPETDDEHAILGNREFFANHRRSVQSSLAGAGLLGAAGGAALVGLLASPASASSSPDVQMLQTAASIENLAVSTYKTALTLPYIGGSTANPVVTKFCQVTESQHAQHGQAFNAAVKQMGGKAQTKPDPAFVPVVKKAVASLAGASATQGALGVVALALELENIAAETYVNDTVKAKNAKNKALFASIMGVEAQHASVLLAVQALLKGGAPQLIALSPTTVAQLPAAAGSVGFPNAFYPTSKAAPANQGAVK